MQISHKFSTLEACTEIKEGINLFKKVGLRPTQKGPQKFVTKILIQVVSKNSSSLDRIWPFMCMRFFHLFRVSSQQFRTLHGSFLPLILAFLVALSQELSLQLKISSRQLCL